MLKSIDNKFHAFLRKWGIDILRICLGVVFLWFGLLKVLGATPVADLIKSSFDFLPFEFPIFWLGIIEVIIGTGLLLKMALRFILGIMWVMLAGTFLSLVFNPGLFFDGNIFLLSTEGEFVIKNLVLLSAGMVIGGYEVK
ncbi:MAG: hypothetical protein KW793_02425 [Candidatus Doudnabacteria bacterium]|nr:hypothetical protein [Candidatus Doudnabacteria bacterium]